MIEPRNTKVVLKKIELTESTTSSGIIVKQEIQVDGLPTGVIIACGPDVKELAVGDTVVFNGGMFVWDNAERLVMIEDKDILGVMK
jgi:co-chaperonin GroES (HSP10)